MKPLDALSGAELARIRVIAFDLDDTLLTDGALLPSVYSALGALRDAGLVLVAVTGRPLGYGEVLARLFPVAGIVVENGSLSVRRTHTGALAVVDPVPEVERRARLERLTLVEASIRAALPNARYSDDMPQRRSELTFDVGERWRMPEAEIVTMLRIIHGHGAWATRSSVHVHATFDRTNKAEGLIRFVRELDPRCDAGAWRHRILFVGDSGNDAACFAGFPTTVGVANVREAIRSLTVLPRYVTRAEKGLGFQELALHILREKPAIAPHFDRDCAGIAAEPSPTPT